MPLDIDYLLQYPFGKTCETLTKRNAALYALSCGLGADPMDERQLDFVDYDRHIKILPSMPVVLANGSGFMKDRKIGLDFVQVAREEQTVKNLISIPVTCEITD